MSHEIVLHIGMNKTGTSAIQQYFRQNYSVLLKNGLLYPRSGRHAHAHHYLSKLLGSGRKLNLSGRNLNMNDAERKKRVIKIKQSLISEINKNSIKKTIMSSENFIMMRKLGPVVDYFREFDMKIIVYLRRHDYWFESAYTQGLKMTVNPSWGKGFDNYLKYKKESMSKNSYRSLVDRWANLFGKNNIIVRPYEAIQNQPDLISDFMEHAGLSAYTDNTTITARKYNQMPHPLALKMLESVQRINMPNKLRSLLVNLAINLPRPAKKPTFLSPSARRLLIEENMDDYQYIAREYLGRSDGKLFYEPLPDADGSE